MTTNDSPARPTHLATGEVTLFGDFVAGVTNVAPSTSVALSVTDS